MIIDDMECLYCDVPWYTVGSIYVPYHVLPIAWIMLQCVAPWHTKRL